MPKPYFKVWIATAATTVMAVGMVSGQNYPTKPIRLFTSNVGGGNDFLARVLAQELTGPLAQPVIVENRPGVVSAETVAKAAPDGHTLLVAGGSLWLGPLLEEMPYDVERDFAPIVLTGAAPNVLAVHPSLPVRSVKDLVALAKAKPGALNYSSAGTGGSAHLAAELFKIMAGVKIVRVAYKGNAPALNALLSGEVQLTFPNTSSAAPYLKSGRIRALAVTGSQPSALVPGLPTVSASGVPGYEAIAIDGVLAPAKTPAAIINRLNQEIVRVLSNTDVKAKFFNAGVEVVGSSPERLAAAIKTEISVWGKVIKDAGMRGQ